MQHAKDYKELNFSFLDCSEKIKTICICITYTYLPFPYILFKRLKKDAQNNPLNFLL